MIKLKKWKNKKFAYKMILHSNLQTKKINLD